MAVTSIYRAIMLECEQRRIALGLPMERMSEWMGISDRSYPKYLNADTPSGRQAQWPTLQTIIDALYPHGFEVIIKPKPGAVIGPDDMKAARLELRARENPVLMREIMAQRGAMGQAAYKAKTKPEDRRKWAKKALKTRWNRYRQMVRELKRRGKEIEEKLPAQKGRAPTI